MHGTVVQHDSECDKMHFTFDEINSGLILVTTREMLGCAYPQTQQLALGVAAHTESGAFHSVV